MKDYANYWLAFLFCIAGTVMAFLTEHKDAYWLLISDANVAIWLTAAAIMDSKRGKQ